MQIWRLLWRGVDYAMALILMLMIALVFVNVVMRYGFSSGLRQSVELSRLGLVWLVMLGAAAAIALAALIAAVFVASDVLETVLTVAGALGLLFAHRIALRQCRVHGAA